MEALVALVVLILIVAAGTAVVLPIIAMVQASRATERIEMLESQLRSLHVRLVAAENRVHQLEQRPAAVPASSAASPAPAEAAAPEARVVEAEVSEPRAVEAAASEPPRVEAPGPFVSSVRVAEADLSGAAQPATTEVASQAGEGGRPFAAAGETTAAPVEQGPIAAPEPRPAPVEVAPDATESAAARPGIDFEGLIGVRLFAWVGGAALFIGAALFLHYSIQHNLIEPPVRVGIGLVAGAAALAFGDWLRPRANWAGQATAGAGVAILYASIFAARTLYQLIPTPAAFAAMAVVTLVAGLIAIRRDAYILAVLGMIGGFLTPYLLSTGEDRAVALFAYVGLLDLGVIAVARNRRWYSLGLLGLVGSAAIYLGWAGTFLEAHKVPVALGAALVIAALFALVRQAPKPREDESAPLLPRVVACVGAAAPLVVALFISGPPALRVEPALLVPYVIIVSAGAFIAARRSGFQPLIVVASALATLTLLVRVGADLFPDHRASALALFSLVPLAYWAAWYVRRNAPEGAMLLASAAVTLAGSAAVALHVVGVESRSESSLPLIAYVATHAALLVVTGLIRRGGGWLLGAQGLAFLALLLVSPRFDDDRLAELVIPVAASMLVFWALPALHPRARPDRIAWFSSALALLLHFPLIFLYGRGTWHDEPLGAGAVACALLALVMLRTARAETADQPDVRLGLSALFGAVTLAFVTAAIPILLSNEWLTVAWALEVAALAWLVTHVPHRGLVIAAVALAAAVCVRLVVNPWLWEYHVRSGTPVINWLLYTFGIPAAAFLVAAWQLSPNELARQLRLPAILRVAAVVIFFVLLNVEIADFYSRGQTITLRLSGETLAEDMTYSLSWGVFSLGLLGIGMWLRSRATRIGAILVLLLTVGKVFLHDLWELGALYRVASVIGLALALLAMSFLIQRFILRKDTP